MNSIGVEYLHPLSAWLWQASWQGTLVAAVVLATRWALRKHLSAWWRNALWTLVLARLLLPALPHTRFSAYNWLPTGNRAAPSLISYPPSYPPGYSPRDSNREASAVYHSAPRIIPSDMLSPKPHAATLSASHAPSSPLPLLPLIWMAGCLATSAYTVAAYLRLGKRVRRFRIEAPEALYQQFRSAKAELKVRRAELIVSKAVSTPFVTGLWKARVILPAGLEDKLSPEDIQMVLRHELAHVKRGDLWTTWLSWLAAMLHWFNPCIRYALALARKDREMACDEWVLRLISDARAYGGALIRFMELNEAPARAASFGAIGIFESKSALFQRARRIAAYRRPTRLSAATGCATVLIIGLFTLTAASDPLTSAPEEKADVVLTSGADRLGGPPKTVILDADGAARLAASLANAEAKREFGWAPFTPAQDIPMFSKGRWEWRATAGHGKGDLQAIVSFTQTGSKAEVRLQTLILAPPVVQ